MVVMQTLQRYGTVLLLLHLSTAFQPRIGQIQQRQSIVLAASPWTMMPDEPKPNEEPRKPAPKPPRPPPLPTVEGESGGQLDVVSRLLKDRILLLGTEVNDEVANVLVAQLLYLANDDPEKEITLYINSPGGSVSAGLAIFDTMKFIPCDVQTVCFGMAASMGAFLLGAGTPGKRKSLPNARVMIHQPLGGAQGQAADIEIQAKEILFTKALLNKYIADYTGQPVEKIEEDCDRDFFMTPYEAKDYGIIDEGTLHNTLGGFILTRNTKSHQDQKEPHSIAGHA